MSTRNEPIAPVFFIIWDEVAVNSYPYISHTIILAPNHKDDTQGRQPTCFFTRMYAAVRLPRMGKAVDDLARRHEEGKVSKDTSVDGPSGRNTAFPSFVPIIRT